MEYAVVIVASLLSGLIGIFVSSWFYSNLEKRKLKIDTVKRLLGYRYHLKGEGFTRALNETIIVFADNEKVVKAVDDLLVTVTTPGKPNLDDKMVTLFKAVCKDVKSLPEDINDTIFLNAFNIVAD